jgi:hypothetical protein
MQPACESIWNPGKLPFLGVNTTNQPTLSEIASVFGIEPHGHVGKEIGSTWFR